MNTDTHAALLRNAEAALLRGDKKAAAARFAHAARYAAEVA